MILIIKFFEEIPAGNVQPLLEQLKALTNKKIIFVHLSTMFMLAVHYTVYTYFILFLVTSLYLEASLISVFYFLFGISAVACGVLGVGFFTRIGSKKSILIILGSFSLSLFILPYSTIAMPIFIIAMMIWGGLSWALAPAQQDYIVQTDPVYSDIHQSFNN